MMGWEVMIVETMMSTKSRTVFILQFFYCVISCRDNPIDDKFMFSGLCRFFCIQFFCRLLNIGNIWYWRVAFSSFRYLP